MVLRHGSSKKGFEMVKITELLDTQNVAFKKTQKGPDVKYTWDVQGRTFEAVMGEDFDDASRETIEDFYGIVDVPPSMPELFPLYNFVFWDEEQSSAISGKGNAAQVFTGAAAVLLDFIATYSEGPFAFGFSAKEPSRMRLYDTFAKALSRKLNLLYSTGLVPPDDEDKLYLFWVTKKGDTVMTESRNIKRLSLVKERTSKIFERAKILALRKYPKTDERYYPHALAIAKRMQEDLLDAALSDVVTEPEKVDSASKLNDTAKGKGEESKQATAEEPWGAESTRIEKQKVKESLDSDEPPDFGPSNVEADDVLETVRGDIKFIRDIGDGNRYLGRLLKTGEISEYRYRDVMDNKGEALGESRLPSDEPPNYNPDFSGSYDEFVGEGPEQQDVSQDEEDDFKKRVISDEEWERNVAEWDAAHPEGIFSEAKKKGEWKTVVDGDRVPRRVAQKLGDLYDQLSFSKNKKEVQAQINKLEAPYSSKEWYVGPKHCEAGDVLEMTHGEPLTFIKGKNDYRFIGKDSAGKNVEASYNGIIEN
jgi:hypothetical protein